MKKQFHLTKDGVAALKVELKELIAQRGTIAQHIKTAREFGDITENAEYASAREEQNRTESRIIEIQHILQNVEIIAKPKGDGKVQLGSHVKLKSKTGKTREFSVIGTVEADPSAGKVSDESPIGKALLGKAVGDAVEIKTPAETTTYKVIEIS